MFNIPVEMFLFLFSAAFPFLPLSFFVILFVLFSVFLRQSHSHSVEFYSIRYRTHSLSIQFVYFLERQAISIVWGAPCIVCFVPYAATHVMRTRSTHMDSVVRTLMRHERNQSGEESYKYFTNVYRTFHY